MDKERLYIFSDFNKCKEFLMKLKTDDHILQDKFIFNNTTFEHAITVADEHHMEVALDYPDMVQSSEKFILYDKTTCCTYLFT